MASKKDIEKIKKRIKDAFRKYAKSANRNEYKAIFQALPSGIRSGKLYEALILSEVIKNLAISEGFNLKLKNSQYLNLKASPGPINRNYAYIEVWKGSKLFGELWTDIEFRTLSSKEGFSDRSNYHELDVVLVKPGETGRPDYDKIFIGIECKNTLFNKGIFREVLGLRREMGYKVDDKKTEFNKWPRKMIPYSPPSCYLIYSSDEKILDFRSSADFFGIDLLHVEVGD
ncbi:MULTISPECIES: hypothetical protein [unclassified Leptospira]|uniref:hypothetical protein n=1 Tax=unclassified Leptospira TaxID=2633828 RepID=UPI0002BF27C5|nr:MULTISPECIES: hypothetical protein [unclassified Leptospira]EMJ99129.1 hypothetical protein LEP1GSC192_0484 [Leptospira sp. B5-022]MCR1795817.1 hypothetical protein [Leptospira sp. id769339]